MAIRRFDERRAARRYRREQAYKQQHGVAPATEHTFHPTPTVEGILAIPLATAGEFELSDREVATLRSRVYAINKDGIRRYRTMREGVLLYVWRIQ